MKRLLLTTILVFFSGMAFAQTANVTLLNIDQLQKRIANTDTLYIVNFWATWCAPCVAELPNFDALQQAHRNQPVKVLLVSMDFRSKLQSDVIPFVQNHKMNTEVFMADKTNEQTYIDQVDKSWTGDLPATLVVNNKKGLRKLYDKEFTLPELNEIYQTYK